MKTLEGFSTWTSHPISTAISCLDMAHSYQELRIYAAVIRGMLMVMKYHAEVSEEELQALLDELDAELGKGEVRQ